MVSGVKENFRKLARKSFNYKGKDAIWAENQVVSVYDQF